MPRPRRHCPACQTPLGPSPREQQVLEALAQGQTTRAIAEALGVSVKTVEAHVLHLRHKLELRNIQEVIVYACEQRFARKSSAYEG